MEDLSLKESVVPILPNWDVMVADLVDRGVLSADEADNLIIAIEYYAQCNFEGGYDAGYKDGARGIS